MPYEMSKRMQFTLKNKRLMECKNGDDSMGDCVASCAADGGVGG